MPAYLGLCLRTWQRNAPDYEVIVLDHSNLAQYAGAGVLDLETLAQVSPNIQKDAVMFAVLARHGGLFMDMDTIVFSGMDAFRRELLSTELVTFSRHMAVTGARRESTLVHGCLERIRQRLERLRADGVPSYGVWWNFFGNAVLDEQMVATCRAASRLARVQGRFTEGVGRILRPAGTKAAAFPRRVDGVLTRWRYRFDLEHLYRMLDRDRHGFIAERVHGNRRIRDREQRYLDYWFEQSDEHRPPPGQVPIIGLHHSWTPRWYMDLDEAAVLAHPCLMSRTLRAALA
jgi:hypothetical protein